MCGDVGLGAMEEPSSIALRLVEILGREASRSLAPGRGWLTLVSAALLAHAVFCLGRLLRPQTAIGISKEIGKEIGKEIMGKMLKK